MLKKCFAVSFLLAFSLIAQAVENSIHVINYAVLTEELGKTTTIPPLKDLKQTLEIQPKVEYIFFLDEKKSKISNNQAPVIFEARVKGFGFPIELARKMRNDGIELPYSPAGEFSVIQYALESAQFKGKSKNNYVAVRYGVPFPITKEQWDKYKVTLETFYHFDDQNYGPGTAVPN